MVSRYSTVLRGEELKAPCGSRTLIIADVHLVAATPPAAGNRLFMLRGCLEGALAVQPVYTSVDLKRTAAT